ncbi:MAG: PKD domain-containing protein, partial [Bacteroidota bacterium]
DEFVTASVDNPAGFTTIRYDFGDGTVIDTNATTLEHTYTAGGDYAISVTLLNPNCGDFVAATQAVSLAEFAFADTDAKTPEGCAPFTLTVNDESTGAYSGSRWDFPGAEPTVVFDSISPTVTYSTPGVYEGSLTLLGALGADTVVTFTVTITPTPTADFTFSVDTATAVFTGMSDVADTFTWDFGDGSGTSSEANPTYSYDSVGTFLVTLEASIRSCTTTVTQEVTIDVLSDLTELAQLGVRLFPNPTSGQLQLTGEATLLDVFDLNGRLLRPLGGQTADLTGLPAGTYLVRVLTRGRVFSVRILRR